MTAPLRLSKSEVADLTGSTQKARQLEFLRQNGVRHMIDLAGWPVVLWSAVEGTRNAAPTEVKAWKSNKVA